MQQNPFQRGMRDAVPIVIGYIPVALAFGLLARSEGIGFGPTAGFSLLVFAGASQFIALNMLGLSAGIWEIIATVFLVNLRHLLMSAFLARRTRPSPLVPLAALGVTDETFATAASKQTQYQADYLLGLNLAAYLAWTLGTMVGFFVGRLLPAALELALGTALYALFLSLLVPQVRASWRCGVVAGAAGGLHMVLTSLDVLSSGLRIVLAVLAASLPASLLWSADASDQSRRVPEGTDQGGGVL